MSLYRNRAVLKYQQRKHRVRVNPKIDKLLILIEHNLTSLPVKLGLLHRDSGPVVINVILVNEGQVRPQ